MNQLVLQFHAWRRLTLRPAYQLPKLYKILEFFGFETGAFSQLTREYMQKSFNPRTPNVDGVRWATSGGFCEHRFLILGSYYSYGAQFEPRIWSAFRQSHHVIKKIEGQNDGMVSVTSSQWGEYKGTLNGVNHLDLINWTNRLRWFVWELTGNKRT